MSKYNPNIHHRRSIRLKGYDYTQAGLYFITLCVQNRQHLFGEIKNGVMQYSVFGEIAYNQWLQTQEIRKNCTLGAFIIMPNHFHAIISIDYSLGKSENIGKFKSPSQSIGAIIRGYKGATTKKIKEIIYKNRSNSGSTGELQFAPTDSAPTRDSALKDSSSEKDSNSNKNINNRLNSDSSTGELQFAPTRDSAPGRDSALNKNFALADTIDLSKSIWQRDYYEHIIRNEKALQRIENYIINNPLKWTEDKFNS